MITTAPVTVYYAVCPETPLESHVDALLAALPAATVRKIRRFKLLQDQWHRAAGRYLLREALRYFDATDHLFETLTLNPHGKPLIAENDMSVSISHSGRIAACTIAKGLVVGLDIEKIRPITIRDFAHFFSPEIFATIVEADDPQAEFFDIWTKIESVLKADGRGLSLKSTVRLAGNRAAVENRLDTWYLSKLNLHPGHVAHLSTNQEKIPVACRRLHV